MSSALLGLKLAKIPPGLQHCMGVFSFLHLSAASDILILLYSSLSFPFACLPLLIHPNIFSSNQLSSPLLSSLSLCLSPFSLISTIPFLITSFLPTRINRSMNSSWLISSPSPPSRFIPESLRIAYFLLFLLVLVLTLAEILYVPKTQYRTKALPS